MPEPVPAMAPVAAPVESVSVPAPAPADFPPTIPGGVDAAIAIYDKLTAPDAAPAPAAPAAPATAAAPEPAPAAAPEPAVAPADDLAARLERVIAQRADVQQRLQRAEADARRAQEADARAARLEALAKDNLPELLREQGWTPEAIVAAMVANDDSKPEVVRNNQVEARLAQLERDNQALRQDIAAREQAVKVATFKAGIIPALSQKSEEFSHSLAFFDPEPLQELVYAEMERVYRDSGGSRVPTVHEAAQAIETQLRTRVSRLKGSSNGVSVAAVESPAPKPPPVTLVAAPKPSEPKTLTNDLSASLGSAPEWNPEDEEARLMKAAATLRNGWSPDPT